MSFTLESQGLDELLARMRRMPADVRVRLNFAIRGAAELVAKQARDNMAALFKGSGKVAEITVRVTRSGDEVTGEITAGGTPYARIHEYGGTVHLPDIFPRGSDAGGSDVLHWVSKSGGEVFARHARAHDVVIPQRSYLRSALDQREADIMQLFRGVTEDANIELTRAA